MTHRLAMLGIVLLGACAAFPLDAPGTAEVVAATLAPLLPALVANYDSNGRACIAAATTRAQADGCLGELRAAWRVWDALEPLRGALDQLVAVELRWQETIATRWPEPSPLAACELPDAGPLPEKDAAP